MTRALCALFLALVCAGAPSLADVTYGIMALPLPTGEASMSIEAQSETGSALAGWNNSGCWYYNGSWDLITSSFSPRGVSRTGYVAGVQTNDYVASGIRVSNGSASVREFCGDNYSTAYGTNDLGLMTGAEEISIPGYGPATRAFVYNWSSGALAHVSTYDLPGSAGEADTMSGAAVNNAGQVVGIAMDGGWRDAWVWTETGGVRSLGMTSGYLKEVWDLSENGIVVGDYNGQVFRKAIGETGWDSIPMAASSYGVGVNDAGIVVSGSNVYINGAVKSITSLLASTGGYSNFVLRDVDNRGTIIARAYNGTKYVPLLLTPMTVGDNMVKNTVFNTMDYVSCSGGGTAAIVTDPDDPGNLCLELTTGSPVNVDQVIDTPVGAFEISFDYRFEDADATIALLLNGEQLDLIGPSAAATSWVNHGYLVTDSSLFDLNGVTLRITLDGASAGLVALVDNLQVQAVPEPATMSMLGLSGLALLRRRRT